jgi:hypothetical protein
MARKKPPLCGGFIKTDVPKRSGQRDAASENAKSERETTNIVHVRVKMG